MSGEGVDAGGTRQPVSHGPQAAAGVCRLHAGERPLRGGTRRPSLSQAPSRPAADRGDSQVTSLTRPNPLQRVAENRMLYSTRPPSAAIGAFGTTTPVLSEAPLLLPIVGSGTAFALSVPFRTAVTANLYGVP